MIPGHRLLHALWLWLVTGVGASFMPYAHNLWLGLGGVLGCAIAIDLVRVFKIKPPTITRQMTTAWPQGIWDTVTLRITNPNPRTISIDLFDHYPVGAEIKGLPRSVTMPTNVWIQDNYQLRPLQRGSASFGFVHLRLASPWRFWQRLLKAGEPERVPVYPNYAPVMKYALLATDNRLSQMGVRRKRRRGEGLEFHQLREYRDGDVLRQIDWKASARTRKLISREYQDERDQQVLFVIDCGRRMRSEDSELSHFDHALNALLLLTHVATRQGDAVGLLTCAGERRWLAPKKGTGVVNAMMNTVFDLQPSTATPDYTTAAIEISKLQRKRALVVWITNLRDEDGDDLLPALRLLRQSHLVLLASLREQDLYATLGQPVTELDQALGRAATYQYLHKRNIMHDKIRREDIHTLDVTPESLPVNLVNHYWDIKGSGQL